MSLNSSSRVPNEEPEGGYMRRRPNLQEPEEPEEPEEREEPRSPQRRASRTTRRSVAELSRKSSIYPETSPTRPRTSACLATRSKRSRPVMHANPGAR